MSLNTDISWMASFFRKAPDGMMESSGFQISCWLLESRPLFD
jgi:hypothetical protein